MKTNGVCREQFVCEAKLATPNLKNTNCEYMLNDTYSTSFEIGHEQLNSKNTSNHTTVFSLGWTLPPICVLFVADRHIQSANVTYAQGHATGAGWRHKEQEVQQHGGTM